MSPEGKQKLLTKKDRQTQQRFDSLIGELRDHNKLDSQPMKAMRAIAIGFLAVSLAKSAESSPNELSNTLVIINSHDLLVSMRGPVAKLAAISIRNSLELIDYPEKLDIVGDALDSTHHGEPIMPSVYASLGKRQTEIENIAYNKSPEPSADQKLRTEPLPLAS